MRNSITTRQRQARAPSLESIARGRLELVVADLPGGAHATGQLLAGDPAAELRPGDRGPGPHDAPDPAATARCAPCCRRGQRTAHPSLRVPGRGDAPRGGTAADRAVRGTERRRGAPDHRVLRRRTTALRTSSSALPRDATSAGAPASARPSSPLGTDYGPAREAVPARSSRSVVPAARTGFLRDGTWRSWSRVHGWSRSAGTQVGPDGPELDYGERVQP